MIGKSYGHEGRLSVTHTPIKKTANAGMKTSQRSKKKKKKNNNNCISHSTNTLGKGLNPIILPPAMIK